MLSFPAFASSVVSAVVDTTAPIGSVTLTPGANGAIAINLTITGNQDGTATFKVNRDWVLSGGTFTGSNPQTFTVPPQSGGTTTSLSADGTVSVAAGQAVGTFNLSVPVFDITNSNQTGGKLTAGTAVSYSVKVEAPVASDTTKPVLTLPTDITAEATDSSGAVVTYSVSATDNVDGSITPTCAPASGSTFPLGASGVTCSATDAANNTATGTFNVTVQDTTAPALSDVPTDITKEATGPDGAVVTYGGASANDLVDGAVSVSYDPASGSTFSLGTHQVDVSATDAAGNTGHASFNVTVQDTTAPAISHVPADITAEATGPSGAAVTYSGATANDLVDGAVSVSYDPASGSTFSLGTHQVDVSATDAAGNTGHASFNVTVQDTTAPAISHVPADITAEATGPSGAAVTYSGATANDLVDGAVSVTYDPASGSTFSLGTHQVDVSATDAAGNTGHASFNVTVQDTTGPELTLPSNITKTATSAAGATVTYDASATDLVDGAVTPVCTPASGSVFGLGKTTVSCTATDSHENGSTDTFVVSVIAPWNGILQPINSNGSSVFKLGSTVPVKFTSFPGLTATLKVMQADSTPDGTYVEPVNSNPADSGWVFRYDSTAGQYIYNLGTKNLSAGDWYLHIDLGDGVDHVVKFSLKK